MGFRPFDFNEAIGYKKDYAEDGLREGSPVVGISYDQGLLLLSVRKSQRKVFEIYDRMLYSAIGNQSDIEAIRQGAIEVAHREGFERSPDDVNAKRIVTFTLSPPLKRLYNDMGALPAVIRAIVAEMGPTPARDIFFAINYDGEFTESGQFAAIAGTPEAEDRMSIWLMGIGPEITRTEAIGRGIKAWAAGAMESRRRTMAKDDDGEEEGRLDANDTEQVANFLRQELKSAHLEVGILERNTEREAKFRLLSDAELEPSLVEYR